MKPTIKRIFLALFLLTLMYSCDRRECSTDNPILVENDVKSSAYQNEVATQIEKIGTKNLRFWLGEFYTENDQPHFILYTQNESLCAQAVVSVNTDNPKLSELVKIEGKGRFNAEFTEVDLDIKNHSNGQKTIEWRSYASIID